MPSFCSRPTCLLAELCILYGMFPFPRVQKLSLEDKKISYYFYLEDTQIHTRHIQIYNRTHMYTQDINRYIIKFHWGTIREKIPKKPL